MDYYELEAGRRLDALVAEKVFDWRWLLHLPRQRIAIFPPVDWEWILWNFNSSEWKETNNEKDFLLFSDWDRLASPRVEGQISFLPYYSSDIDAAWRIDRPNWRWEFIESEKDLEITLYDCSRAQPPTIILWSEYASKSKAYAWGRCITALKSVAAISGERAGE